MPVNRYTYETGHRTGRLDAYTLDRDEACMDADLATNIVNIACEVRDEAPQVGDAADDYARGYAAGYDQETADPAAEWTFACDFNGHRQTDIGRCRNCTPPDLSDRAPDPNEWIAADEAARLDAHDAYMASDERVLLEERFGDELDEARRTRRNGRI